MDDAAAGANDADPGATTGREDVREILRLVRPGARVLDIGCGDGTLLEALARHKAAEGQGLDIRPEAVAACLARGVKATVGDADRDLDALPDRAFDYAVLSFALTQMRDPRHVLDQALRVAGQAIVSVANLGHWRLRLSLLLRGRAPVAGSRPDPWWESRDIHPCSLRDLADLCRELGLRIDAAAALSRGRSARPIDVRRASANLMSESVVLLISSREGPAPAPAATPPARKDLFG